MKSLRLRDCSALVMIGEGSNRTVKERFKRRGNGSEGVGGVFPPVFSVKMESNPVTQRKANPK